MKITILEAGRAPGRLQELYPSYPDMFASLLSGADSALSFGTVALVDGATPPDPAQCDAVLVTGSPAGVYDLTPWMTPLRDFVRGAWEAKTPMIGVCFGHQIIADALGGDVRKSEKGWGVGRHTYDIVARRPWMDGASDRFSLGVSHQDQVIAPPPGAETLARSRHTDHAMLAYDGGPAISLQGHPEFTDGFLAALYGARRGKTLSDDLADQAIESLAGPEDNARVGEWMARFLRTARS
ncbi:MAG: type 1 glutamine amidotransferase [Alphaproteobacteria bacterium]|nr:type 1 glutamine amidotransferase [Alphaproteobacteria bacterium]